MEKIRRQPDGVEVVSPLGAGQFDQVVMATHSDQALRCCRTPTGRAGVLGAIAYQPNQATLHTDARLMPRNRKAWASWNYQCLGPTPTGLP